ncbi:hypothetical protein H0I76_00435 [Limibaculum sp. M0105]|uniref:Uncharacterized protein n=1 Tax=Thermohalobaculum xanthum TaxID=2753746 RepID=A0A8J7M3Q8_9RHOB|nr:DUF6505 family protein [Thermohalobaculum xanthum]MBK0397643.1 hypothetical protein [Thermohalobaculum xanthum]
MRLARTLRFDQSDENVFERAAQPDEWAVSGAFEFSNWSEDDLSGKRRQAFANGWLGLESFGRATFVATAKIEEQEYRALVERLAAHFVEAWGAPDLETARPVAEKELAFMAGLCDEHEPNTLLIVERSLVTSGVSESFRAIAPQEATLDLVAVHVTSDD